MSARVRSIAVELDSAEGGETVVMRPGAAAPGAADAWRSVCSCGASACEHRRAAFVAFGDLAGREESVPPSVGPQSGLPRSGPPDPATDRLSAELGTLIEAMLRAAAGEVTAAVEDALRAALEALAERPLPGVARVLARVSSSLGDRGSAAQTALAITALGEVAAVLEGSRGDEARAEVIGEGPEVARLDDIELVEVARARERGALVWETRVLVDPSAGTLWREEGPAGARRLSGGVSGRRVVASLASRHLSRQPPRLSLMQYTLEPAAPQALLAKIGEFASRELVVPADVAAAPLLGVACPRIGWVSPERVETTRGGAFLVDDGGHRLALDRTRDPGAFEALLEVLDDRHRMRALAGAYQVDVDGVRFQPWSALLAGAHGLSLLPLCA